MDNQTQTQTQTQTRTERWGPEIYVHLEFRVSWGKKNQPAKNHQVTYRSRGARQRSPVFPRQVPAPNTNYLAAIHNFDQRQSRIREVRQSYFNNNPNRHHQMQEYYQGERRGTHLQAPVIREPERPTRADARPSHERGSSAPPPIGENPWDVNVPQDQMRIADQPAAEIKRKPLPAAPSQFRLGEGGQPWSTWSLPVGYDPDTYPKDEEDDEECLPARSEEPVDQNSTMFVTNPTMVSTFSPEPTSPERNRDLETGRVRELEALSAAMMTIDNGFENQWWYQGQRESVIADESRTPDESPVNRWPTTPMETALSSLATPAPLPAGIVSPMTEDAFSPALVPSLLQRTMSTRSEELWFRERSR